MLPRSPSQHVLSSLTGCAIVACASLAVAQPSTEPEGSGNPETEAKAVEATTVAVPSETGSAEREEKLEEAPARSGSTAGGDEDFEIVTERRGGFVLGVLVGPTLGGAKGNPSAKATRDDPAFEQDAGIGLGYRITPFLGGALTDWFTFGLGMSFASLANSDYQTRADTFVFHLEAYPLYGEGGVFRDLGLAADFGAGTSSIRSKSTDEKVAESGVASTVGLGVFWEPLRLWQLAGGPYVGYQRNWSRWYGRDDVMVGFRMMFYGDQP